mgnify:CR=1 FL=1
MGKQRLTYAAARRWLGKAGVGFWVLISIAGLIFGWAEWLFPQPGRSLEQHLIQLGTVLAFYIGLQSPFDIFGGYILPRLYRREPPTALYFFLSWARGVLIQSLFIGGSWLAILLAAEKLGYWAGVAVFFAIMVLLAIVQLGVARLLSPFSPAKADLILTENRLKQWGQQPTRPIRVMAHRDMGFTGGITGFPGGERLVLPERWVRFLPPDALALAILRRNKQANGGARLLGLGFALAFNLVGFILASQLAGGTLTSVPALLETAFGFTLWGFLGLLTLPSLTRPAVFRADASLCEQNLPLQQYPGLVRQLDDWGENEPSRGALTETIFHPIPAPEHRIERMEKQATPGGFRGWHTARYALYTSWAGGSFVSRAVHCNVGRPELWVFLPSD